MIPKQITDCPFCGKSNVKLIRDDENTYWIYACPDCKEQFTTTESDTISMGLADLCPTCGRTQAEHGFCSNAYHLPFPDEEEDDIYDAVMHYRKDHPEKQVKVPQEVDWNEAFNEWLHTPSECEHFCEWAKTKFKLYKK